MIMLMKFFSSDALQKTGKSTGFIQRSRAISPDQRELCFNCRFAKGVQWDVLM